MFSSLELSFLSSYTVGSRSRTENLGFFFSHLKLEIKWEKKKKKNGKKM